MFTSAERVLDYIDTEQEIPKNNNDTGGNQSTLLLHEVANDKFSNNVQKTKDNSSKGSADNLGGDIEMAGSTQAMSALSGQHITARYKPELPPVLKSISFQLHRGRLVGVCGRSGSSKSSLAMLIAQAFPNIEGGILSLDGNNALELSLTIYRTRIAIFPQDSFIFSGKLRDYLDPNRDYTDIELNSLLLDLTKASGKESEMKSNVLALSLNLDNEIASGGSNLSAGEKQIAVLARAALTRATHIVVLDEITSNMDRESAVRALLVLKARLVKAKKLAVLVIAHNLDDIIACDEVWVMKDGVIIEKGDPQELISQNISYRASSFKEMWSIHHSHAE